ncbi:MULTISPECIES: hypothetical protein [Streptomyces]|uniref:Uncharacterized protein n=2 Tax=Streptomyces TaxID=1883 RepID=A0ABU4KFX4_9ACTN|nr:hypothetical protein [Streptomyces roseolus]MDX2296684.1 hypothetical protein [Streptomyces roseolus]
MSSSTETPQLSSHEARSRAHPDEGFEFPGVAEVIGDVGVDAVSADGGIQ